MSHALDAHTDEKLSRFAAPYKQLVHYVARNMSDEECAKRLRTNVAIIQRAVIRCADFLSVSEGTYEERRRGLSFVGKKFFGFAIVVPSATPVDAEALHFPSMEDLVASIEELSPEDRYRLERVAQVEDGNFIEVARELRIAPNTAKMLMPTIGKKLGFVTRTTGEYIQKRREYIKEALELIEKAEK